MKKVILLSVFLLAVSVSSAAFAKAKTAPVSKNYIACVNKAAKTSEAWQDAGDCFQKAGVETKIINALIAAHKGCKADPVSWGQQMDNLYSGTVMKACGTILTKRGFPANINSVR